MSQRLEVDRLTVALGDARRARVSLSLEPGAVAVVSGPSGAGKSTLLRAIAQLVEPVDGTVRLDGRSPEAWGWPTYRRRCVYVAQRPAMLDASVLENLARPFAYRSAPRAFDRAAAERGLAALRLPDDVLARPARELSVGEQQRVAFLRAVLVAPDVYLCDEPTSALDPEAEGALEAMLEEEVRSRGASVVVVTHQAAQIERLAASRHEIEAP